MGGKSHWVVRRANPSSKAGFSRGRLGVRGPHRRGGASLKLKFLVHPRLLPTPATTPTPSNRTALPAQATHRQEGPGDPRVRGLSASCVPGRRPPPSLRKTQRPLWPTCPISSPWQGPPTPPRAGTFTTFRPHPNKPVGSVPASVPAHSLPASIPFTHPPPSPTTPTKQKSHTDCPLTQGQG